MPVPTEMSALTEDSEPSCRKPVRTSGIDFLRHQSVTALVAIGNRHRRGDLNGTNLHEVTGGHAGREDSERSSPESSTDTEA
ncbi:hypothetical protein HispidOSU_018623 [Sigmodon hispidus]